MSTALSLVWTRGTELTHCGPLQGLGKSARARTMTHDPVELIRELTARFPGDELVSMGLLEVDDDGELCFVDALRSPDTLLVPLWKTRFEIYDIVTPTGLLIGDMPAVIGALGDVFVSRGLKRSSNRLFLVGNSMDLAVLSDLHLPAALATDLCNSRDLLRQFLEHFAWLSSVRGQSTKHEEVDRKKASPEFNVDPKKIMLVFVNWSPGQLSHEACPQLLSLITEMDRARRLLDLDMTRVGVWSPSTEVLEYARSCLDWRSPTHVRRLLLDSADDDTQRIGYFLDQQSATEMDYVSVRRKLEDVIRKVDAGELPSDALRKAKQQYEKKVCETFFEPALWQAIGNTKTNRGAQVILAELERKILTMAPCIHKSSENGRAVSDSTLEFTKLTSEYMRALKALHKK